MTHLMIKDLVEAKELDRAAMSSVYGGEHTGVGVSNSWLLGSSITTNIVDVDVNTLTNITQIANVNVNVASLFGGPAIVPVGVSQSAPQVAAPSVGV